MSEKRLTEVVAQWFEGMEWEERPEFNEENRTSTTGFGYKLSDDFSVKCFSIPTKRVRSSKCSFTSLMSSFLQPSCRRC